MLIHVVSSIQGNNNCEIKLDGVDTVNSNQPLTTKGKNESSEPIPSARQSRHYFRKHSPVSITPNGTDNTRTARWPKADSSPFCASAVTKHRTTSGSFKTIFNAAIASAATIHSRISGISLAISAVRFRAAVATTSLRHSTPFRSKNGGDKENKGITMVKRLSSEQHIIYVKNESKETKDISIIVEKFKLTEGQNKDLDNDTHISLINKDVGKENKDIPDREEKSEEAIIKELYSSRNFGIKPEVISVFKDNGVVRHPPRLGAIEWSWLNEEKWRLLTFSNYPQNAAKSAILLAADGFAYIGCGKDLDDSVICFSCESTKNKWKQSDDIPEVHSHLCSSCSMVTKINCTNVPFIAEMDSRLFDVNVPKLNKSTVNRYSEIEHDGAIPVNDIEQAAEPFLTSKPVAASGSLNTIGFSLPRQTNSEISRFQHGIPNLSDSFSTSRSSTSYHCVPNSGSVAVAPSVTSAPQDTVASSSTSSSVSVSSEPVTAVTAASSRSSNAVSPAPVAPADTTVHASETPVAFPAESVATSQVSSATSNTTSQANASSGQNTAKGGATGPTYSELGIITERPKQPEYALKIKRLETYSSWPRNHQLKPEDLAEAGFYYAGYGDCARCFYCGGGLRSWEDEDDVWVEHARWFPKCAYIRQQMGQVFVDVVQELNKTNDQISFKMVKDKIGAAASAFQLDYKYNSLKRDPAVKTVVDMGNEIEDVIAVAENIKKDECDIKPRKNAARKSGSDAESEANVRRDLAVRNLIEENKHLHQLMICMAVVFLGCDQFVVLLLTRFEF